MAAKEKTVSSTARRQSHDSDATTQFQFINVDPGSSVAGRRSNNQLAHSHLARVHRQRNRKQERAVSSQVFRRQSLPPVSASPLSGTAVGPSRSQSDIPTARHELWQDLSLPNAYPPFSLGTLDGGATTSLDDDDPGTCRSPDEETTITTDPYQEFFRLGARESPVRTLSPVLGAMFNQTLECASPSILAQTIDTKLNLTWPKYSKPFDIASRMQLFYEKPIIFHGFTVASAVHRDVLRNEPNLSRNHEIIAHHGQLIHLLSELLSDLDDSKLELAVLGILLLTLADLDWDKLQGEHVLPFRPHMATANWINVFGRIMSVDERRFEDHIRAMATLVSRRGGLDGLLLPGLGIQVAYQDLIGASRTIRKPTFPCVWTLDESVLSACRLLQAPCRGEDTPGYGFRFLARIPHHVIACLVLLSSVDALMPECHTPGTLDHSNLVNARNTLQHRLLSLPEWDELTTSEREQVDYTTYECCRMTALLYSTAVVFGMPPHTNWHMKLVVRIRKLLQPDAYKTWNQELSSLLIWILVIAGIASYRSTERRFFEQALQSTLRTSRLWAWQAVERLLSQFLWSDPACSHGAAVLWDALELNARASAPI